MFTTNTSRDSSPLISYRWGDKKVQKTFTHSKPSINKEKLLENLLRHSVYTFAKRQQLSSYILWRWRWRCQPSSVFLCKIQIKTKCAVHYYYILYTFACLKGDARICFAWRMVEPLNIHSQHTQFNFYNTQSLEKNQFRSRVRVKIRFIQALQPIKVIYGGNEPSEHIVQVNVWHSFDRFFEPKSFCFGNDIMKKRLESVILFQYDTHFHSTHVNFVRQFDIQSIRFRCGSN